MGLNANKEEPQEENEDSIKHRFASLFLQMQTILHVSAIQKIIDERHCCIDIGELPGKNSKGSIENVGQRQHNYDSTC